MFFSCIECGRLHTGEDRQCRPGRLLHISFGSTGSVRMTIEPAPLGAPLGPLNLDAPTIGQGVIKRLEF